MNSVKIEVPVFSEGMLVNTPHGEAWVVRDGLANMGQEISLNSYEEHNKVHVILLEDSSELSRGEEVWVRHAVPSIVLKRHLHVCSQCWFLGRHDDNDLYFCPNEPTIIARYGADGEYRSGLVFGYLSDPIPELEEALKRALCIPMFREKITTCVEQHEKEFPDRIESFHKILKEVA